MTAPVYQPMNVPIGTDAADMPHVLGDPADALWQGHAERINSNFAAFNALAQIAESGAKPLELRDAAVITPASGLAAPLNGAVWSLAGGFAFARTLSFVGGAKMVHLTIRLQFIGTGIYWTTVGGLFEQFASMPIGTLAVPLRPVAALQYRVCAAFHGASKGYEDQCSCDLSINTAGVISLNRTSNPTSTLQKPADITFSHTFFTNSS